MQPRTVNLAPTGMMPTRRDFPRVPLSIAEIAADCGRCHAAGTSMPHLHLRDRDGVRTGLEDNLWLDEARTTPATNLQLVEGVAAQAAAFGRTLASPDETRRRPGLAVAS